MNAILVLGCIALLAAVILWFCSRRFAVAVDPREEKIVELLPGANCGGCGYAGCSGFAAGLVKVADAGSVSGMSCPVGGEAVMRGIAEVLGVEAGAAKPMVAVVRCNGACSLRTPTNVAYDGLTTCASKHACGMTDTACGYGCLGCGDCVKACRFGAITMNADTHLPEVDKSRCTGCRMCVEACPRQILDLHPLRPKGREVYVACVNRDKGAVARKACSVACIGCSKCVKACAFDAIQVADNLSRIDPDKCRLCRKCVGECPTQAIHAVGFPAPKTAEA